jgi:hypothetical protein
MELTQEMRLRAPAHGNFILARKCTEDNIWYDLGTFTIPSDFIYYDYNIEQGKTYQYSLQQYNFITNKPNARAGRALSAEITVDFEHIYLCDESR